jgi:hypothetical protein
MGWWGGNTGWGLEIAEQKWGFDGQVRKQQFNLLSVLLSNPGTTAFDGEVRLERIQGFDVVDAPMVETLYIAPGVSRWVQFYPWIDEVGFQSWRVVWGKEAGQRSNVSSPRGTRDNPALVVLEQSGQIARPNVATVGFAEELFPRSITGCAGLRGVILDHEPRWSEAQQQAFVDWIRLGGELHLVQGAAGRVPTLTGVLAVLNQKSGKEPLGAGQILRHEVPLAAFDRETIRSRILSGNKWKRERGRSREEGGETPEPVPDSGNLFSDQNLEFDEPVLRNLKQLTRAEHSWVLIHLLSLVFLALVFPGAWWLGQWRRGDYRMVFGTLLATIGLFSLTFLWVGRRGAGEATIVDSLLLAERIEAGRYRVSGWTNVFVTTGGDYELRHQGSGRLYSSGQSTEGMRGMIRAGAEAALVADMPPFSSRTLLSRVEAVGPDMSARIQRLKIGSAQSTRYEFKSDRIVNKQTEMRPVLDDLELQLTTSDSGMKPLAAWVVFDQAMYVLSLSAPQEAGAGAIARRQQSGQSLPEFFRVEDGFMGGFTNFGAYGYPVETDRKMVYLEGLPKLMQRALEFQTTRDVLESELPSDRIRVFVETEVPGQFWLQGERLPRQQGRCLFCFDVLLESNP